MAKKKLIQFKCRHYQVWERYNKEWDAQVRSTLNNRGDSGERRIYVDEEAIDVQEEYNRKRKMGFKKNQRKLEKARWVQSGEPVTHKERKRNKKRRERREKEAAETQSELVKRRREEEEEVRIPVSSFDSDSEASSMHGNERRVKTVCGRKPRWRKIHPISCEEETKKKENDKYVEDSEDDVDNEMGSHALYNRISECTDTYAGDERSEAEEIKVNRKKDLIELKKMAKMDANLASTRRIHEENKGEGCREEGLVRRRIRELPATHFDLRLNKRSFRTDVIEMKNYIWDEMGTERHYFKKKAIVFLQAAAEHHLTFAFSLCGLFFVLSTSVATRAHLRLFSILLEEISLYRPAHPIERLLKGENVKAEYTRADEEQRVRREKETV